MQYHYKRAVITADGCGGQPDYSIECIHTLYWDYEVKTTGAKCNIWCWKRSNYSCVVEIIHGLEESYKVPV